MLIGIEAERANAPQKTGVEHYAQQLILQFAELSQKGLPFKDEKGNPLEDLDFVLYLRSEPEEWIKKLPQNFSYKVMPFPIFWTQLRLSWEMLWHKPDALFVPASAAPVISPKKTVCTIHDSAFLFYPETFTPFMRKFLHYSYKFISWKAWKIVVPSKASKDDLVKYYHTDPGKIQVIYHGYTPQSGKHEILSPKFETNSNTQNIDPTPHPIRSTLNLPARYVLFLSTLQPRKNLEGLVDAMKLFRTRNPSEDVKLVVAGRVGWKVEHILEKIDKNKELVLYLNHVTDDERAELYQKAEVFCVPSFYEGFGMWILEAFDAGVPVITSNISSMPEVGGEAVEYCDPHSTESIEKALENVLLNPQRKTQLRELGFERLKQFSWEKCGRETLEVLASVFSEQKG